MKAIKAIVGLVVVLLVVVAIGVVVLFGYIDRIARVGIEKAGTYALGVPTTLESADVAIFGGSFAMSGLAVANPTGFESPHFLSLGDGGVDVTLGSLREETVELPLLGLSGLDVVLERREGKANYKVILDNLKRLESGEKKTEDPAAESGKRFIVRKVDIQDVAVTVDLLPIGGDLTKVDLSIDEIVLTDVGSESDRGVLLSELSNILVKAILAAIVEKGGNIIPADLLTDLQGGLAQLESLRDLGIDMAADVQGRIDEAKGKIDGMKGRLDEAKGDLEDLGKQTDDAMKGLGGLLGGDKKDK